MVQNRALILQAPMAELQVPLFLSSLFLFLLSITSRGSAASAAPAKKIGNGYRLISAGEAPGGGILAVLQVKTKTHIYGSDIPYLQLYVKHETEDRLRVHITDAKKKRWEVPYNLLPRQNPPQPVRVINSPQNNITISEYVGSELIFSYSGDPFSFTVRRKSNGATLFETGSGESDPFSSLVFKDQYLEISTKLPETAALYGLGENTQPRGMKLQADEPYTLYTTDVAAVTLNTDLYGSHPVYMDLRSGGGGANAHGVLLLNSNGMDVFYRGSSLTYKVIGGVFDFYFFAGASPLSVVDQYTAFVGRPAPMPYWALGFHQCRWGYRNLSVVEDVVESYQKAKIPLDVIWNDDDHMDGHKDFTLNPTSYPHPALLSFLDKIHTSGMKYIVLIDPGIAVNSSYPVYNRATSKDVFIKHHGQPYLAQVWPGAVHFPDFLNPATLSWWADEIRRFHQLVPVNGLWIDMNEASNFCTGKCTIPVGKQCPNATGPGWICCLDCKNITDTRWDDPPYKINASGLQVPIGYKTIATSATHYNGVLEYDAHSLYGFSQAIATNKALLELEGKRPFVLTRSTFVGSGKYAAHWTGDNQGTWQDLKYSISTILNFGIFGIPMVGADICGFYPAPTEELCNRWIELGAFYPFSRDHANFYSPRQELYQWESVAISARNALGLRYKILPYLYTLSYEAHTKGYPIARPLFFTFPNFAECYGVSTQFLLGKSLMISPVLEQSKTEVSALFPPGSWYDVFNMTNVIVSKGRYVTLNAPLHVINVHLYQNTIIPMQRGGVLSKEARLTPFSLVVAFPAGDSDGEAHGNLFMDNDEVPEMSIAKGSSSYVEFYGVKSNGRVKIWSEVVAGEFALEKGLVVEKVTVLGMGGKGKMGSFVVNGVSADTAGVSVVTVAQNLQQEPLGEDGDEGNRSLMVEVSGLSLPIGKKFELSWQMSS